MRLGIGVDLFESGGPVVEVFLTLHPEEHDVRRTEHNRERYTVLIRQLHLLFHLAFIARVEGPG